MWDDEEGDSAWDLGEEQPAEETAAVETGAAAAAPAKEDPEAAAKALAALRASRPKADPPYYTYHWVRPLFLNYGYIYDYR